MEKKRISESDSKKREIIKDEREKRQFLSFFFGWEIERCVGECRLRRSLHVRRKKKEEEEEEDYSIPPLEVRGG